MTARRSRHIGLVSVLGAAAGPLLAGLHESRLLSLGPPATLWPLVFIVGGATWGVVAGLRVASRGSRLLGGMIAGPNLLVLLFYGFFLAFFGLGGSR